MKKDTKKIKKNKRETFAEIHQPSVSSIKNIIKSGYLLKEGGGYKSWKSRFFVLDGDTKVLYYYSKPKDKKPLGFVPLWDCKVEQNTEREFQNCFEVGHPDRRTFYMITQTPSEMNEWIEILKKCIKDASREQKSKVNAFWEKYFGQEQSVKWIQFSKSLKEYLKESEKQNGTYTQEIEDQLHFFLATFALKTQPKDEIHLGQMHLFAELFGPPERAYNKLGEMCKWYHGALTSQDVESKLAGCEEGTFLIRMRRFAADSGILALSYIQKKKQIKHVNIFKEPNRDMFYTAYNEPVYKTLKELIEDDPNLKKPYDSNPSVYKEYMKQFTAARIESQERGGSNDDKSNNNNTNTNTNTNTTLKSSTLDGSDLKSEDTDSKYETEESEDNKENKMKIEPSDNAGTVFPNLQSGKYRFVDLHLPSLHQVKGVILKSFMYKEENEGTEWRTRYFVLSDKCKTIYYYKTENDKQPLGFVPLWGCSVEQTEDPENPFSFEISHPDRPTFFLKANSLKEMEEWINACLSIVETSKMEQKIKRELFWMSHFGPETREVLWESFVNTLKEEVGNETSKREEEELRFVISTFAAKNQNIDIVKARQLFLFIELFGDVDKCYKQLGKVAYWYQGSLTSSDSYNKLEDKPNGTFIIRLRRFSADSGLIAITYKENDEIKHVNVFKDPLSECYYLGPEEFLYQSLEELILGTVGPNPSYLTDEYAYNIHKQYISSVVHSKETTQLVEINSPKSSGSHNNSTPSIFSSDDKGLVSIGIPMDEINDSSNYHTIDEISEDSDKNDEKIGSKKDNSDSSDQKVDSDNETLSFVNSKLDEIQENKVETTKDQHTHQNKGENVNISTEKDQQNKDQHKDEKPVEGDHHKDHQDQQTQHNDHPKEEVKEQPKEVEHINDQHQKTDEHFDQNKDQQEHRHDNQHEDERSVLVDQEEHVHHNNEQNDKHKEENVNISNENKDQHNNDQHKDENPVDQSQHNDHLKEEVKEQPKEIEHINDQHQKTDDHIDNKDHDDQIRSTSSSEDKPTPKNEEVKKTGDFQEDFNEIYNIILSQEEHYIKNGKINNVNIDPTPSSLKTKTESQTKEDIPKEDTKDNSINEDLNTNEEINPKETKVETTTSDPSNNPEGDNTNPDDSVGLDTPKFKHTHVELNTTSELEESDTTNILDKNHVDNKDPKNEFNHHQKNDQRKEESHVEENQQGKDHHVETSGSPKDHHEKSIVEENPKGKDIHEHQKDHQNEQNVEENQQEPKDDPQHQHDHVGEGESPKEPKEHVNHQQEPKDLHEKSIVEENQKGDIHEQQKDHQKEQNVEENQQKPKDDPQHQHDPQDDSQHQREDSQHKINEQPTHQVKEGGAEENKEDKKDEHLPQNNPSLPTSHQDEKTEQVVDPSHTSNKEESSSSSSSSSSSDSDSEKKRGENKPPSKQEEDDEFTLSIDTTLHFEDSKKEQTKVEDKPLEDHHKHDHVDKYDLDKHDVNKHNNVDQQQDPKEEDHKHDPEKKDVDNHNVDKHNVDHQQDPKEEDHKVNEDHQVNHKKDKSEHVSPQKDLLQENHDIVGDSDKLNHPHHDVLVNIAHEGKEDKVEVVRVDNESQVGGSSETKVEETQANVIEEKIENRSPLTNEKKLLINQSMANNFQKLGITPKKVDERFDKNRSRSFIQNPKFPNVVVDDEDGDEDEEEEEMEGEDPLFTSKQERRKSQEFVFQKPTKIELFFKRRREEATKNVRENLDNFAQPLKTLLKLSKSLSKGVPPKKMIGKGTNIRKTTPIKKVSSKTSPRRLERQSSIGEFGDSDASGDMDSIISNNNNSNTSNEKIEPFSIITSEGVQNALSFLAKLEDENILTEDEVYLIENLITVKKDELLYAYCTTFKDQPQRFANKVRRHIKTHLENQEKRKSK